MIKKILDDRYGIDERGIVYSYLNTRGVVGDVPKVKKTQIRNNGYEGILFILSDGTKKNLSIHRLVASAFCDKPNGKDIVNHINGVKHDNRAVNLEWCTRSENDLHAFKNNLRKYNGISAEGKASHKLKVGRPVIQMTMDGEYISEYMSTTDAANAVNGSQGTLHMAAIGTRGSHKGFKWKFKNKV